MASGPPYDKCLDLPLGITTSTHMEDIRTILFIIEVLESHTLQWCTPAAYHKQSEILR